MDLTAIDLFCGAGGLTAGLERAGWTTVAAVDHDPDSIRTMGESQASEIAIERVSERRYLDSATLLTEDVRRIRRADVVPRGSSRGWRPTLLAGGPPCQPFSSAGRQAGLNDPRGQLFLEFVRLAEELRPTYLLFENVRGIVTAKTPDGRAGGVLESIQESFEGIGYACRFAILNAADFGAPQRRVRLFMVASCDVPLPDLPAPTHSGDRSEAGLLGLQSWRSLGSLLDGLPDPPEDEIVVPTGAKARDLAELVPGTGLKAQGIVEANRPGGHWGYRQDGFVADQRLPSRTIRAASTPDWIWDRLGRLRRLTWAECAAIQGFPAGWRFVGGTASRFRQIGNAVEGRTAECIGRCLIESLRGASRARPTSPSWPEYFRERVRYTDAEDAVNGEHRRAAKSRSGR